MRGVLAPFLAVTLLVAGCGGGGTSSSPADEPSESTTTSAPVTTGTNAPPSTETASTSTMLEVTTTRSESPPSTATPSSTTSTDPPTVELAVLRPGGLGEVDFGTLADDAVPELTALLGPPDRVERIDPLGPGEEGCPEGAGWLDCVRAFKIIEHGQLAIWEGHGLEVALVDGGFEEPGIGLRFADWHATVARDDVRLLTEDGLSAGMTVGELRQAVPWVEFTYNEGLLDSFSLPSWTGGGYWGRLDWNPGTDAIERGDVSAVQAALNEHGAELVVDGEWGPRSEAAWLQFLTDRGFEPFTLQPWLMPEIGEALGLPPDDITVATLEPRPATATSALPMLRTDGLSRFDFGEPANDLVAELEAILGPAADDTSYTPDGPGPFDFLPNGYWAAYELRIVVWEQPDLHLILSDIPWLGDQFGEPAPGTLHLISWTTTSSSLRLDTGIAVGSSLGELRATYPDVVVGTSNVCETGYDPAAFVTTPFAGDVPPLWLGVRGALDWDWTGDLQNELNNRGAELVVDGIYGPATRAAVDEFQQVQGLDEGTAPDAGGLIGPRTADALDLTAPDSARITRLAAGYPGSC